MERKVKKMKLKNLMFYNNMFGLLNITSAIAKELNGNTFSLGKWYDGTQSGEEQTMFDFTGMNATMRKTLDDFLKVKLSQSDVWSYFDTTGLTDEEIKLVYNDIASLFKAREEQLNRQYYSNLIEYNPIDNYDKTETQTHSESNTIGVRESTITTGARSSSDVKGQRQDTSVDTQETSPFDANAYTKPTDKNTNNFTSGSQTDSHTSEQAIDTTHSNSATDSNNGGYTIRAHGNVGVTQTMDMLERFRTGALFNFCDEIIKIIESDITCMNYDL